MIQIVDRAIMQSALSSKPLSSNLVSGAADLIRRPAVCLAAPEFVPVYAAYAGTYVTANVANSVCGFAGLSGTAAALPKVAVTSLVNIAMCLNKDRILARLYGSATTAAVPLATYLLFITRDLCAMAAGFTLPPLIVGRLASLALPLSMAALTVAVQMLMPPLMELVNTPLHLLALDIYAVPERSAAKRLAFVISRFQTSLAVRMGRAVSSFGIGGVGNRIIGTALRRALIR
jgi:hypothetical protein